MKADTFQNKKLPSGLTEVQAARFIAEGDRASIAAFRKKIETLGIKATEEQKNALVSFVYGMIVSDHAAMLTVYC